MEEAPSPLLDEATRRSMGAAGGRIGKSGRLRLGRYRGVRRRPGQALLFSRDEHAAAGGASGHRARHRHRSGRADDPGGRRRGSLRSSRPTCSSTAGRSKAASMPRIRRAISCRRSDDWCDTGRRPRQRDGGITVRNDTGVAEGGEISIYYDPLIAKLITHGADARRRDRCAGRRARRLHDRGHPPQHSHFSPH